MWKVISVVAVLVALSNAIELHHAPAIIKYAPAAIVKAPVALKTVEYEDAPAEYEFSYSVHDEHTGDIKSQKESRKGDRVEGSYELIDPDGFRRLVEYTSDAHSGFNAIVHREPTDIKIPQPAPAKLLVAAPKLIAAPKLLASPVLHYAPAKLVAAAPVAKVLAPADTHVSYSAPHVSYHY